MADLETDNLRVAQPAQDVDLSDETQDFRFLNIFSKCALSQPSSTSLPSLNDSQI